MLVVRGIQNCRLVVREVRMVGDRWSRSVILKRCAANIIKEYFKNEKKPIHIEIIYIHDLYFYL
jgi:hypothetical protein